RPPKRTPAAPSSSVWIFTACGGAVESGTGCPRLPHHRGSGLLALRELEALAGARTARLLPLDLPRIPRQHTLLAKCAAQLGIECDERARHAEAHRARLARLPAARHRDRDVEAALHRRGDQGLLCMCLVRAAREVIVEHAPVHLPLAVARPQPD